MFPVMTMQGGMAVANPPTVNKVPAAPSPIPTPLPNFFQMTQIVPVTASKLVKIGNQPVVLKTSQSAMSTGDAAGVAGGVKSQQFMGPGKFIRGSALIKVEGQAPVFHTCQTEHNGVSSNTIGMVSVPGQVLVMISG